MKTLLVLLGIAAALLFDAVYWLLLAVAAVVLAGGLWLYWLTDGDRWPGEL